jgi:hypothetical protein
MGKIRQIFRLQKIAGSKRFQVMSLTVLLLAISAGIYFTLYISNQADYFNNRNFRQLNSLSDQVSSRVDDLKNGFRSSVQNTLKGEEPRFGESLKSIVGITFSNIKPKPDQRLTSLSTKDIDHVPCTIDLLPNQGATSLQITCGTAGEFQGNARFAELISPFLDADMSAAHKQSEHEEGFDDILIAKAEDENNPGVPAGQVIFDQGTPELALTSLNNLPLSGNSDKKLDFATFSQTTNSAEVRIGGADYKIYAEPLEMNAGKSGSHWIICGLVETSHFRRQTWAISYTVLVVLAFLISLIPLSWPFLKILFIGPKDRLRLADVYFVSFSLVIGTAVMTMFILWVYSYTRQQTELDSQLATLSNAIASNLRKEVKSALAEIDDFNDKHERAKNSAKALGNANQSDAENAAAGKILDKGGDVKQVTTVLQQLCPGPDNQARIKCLNEETYPYFNIVFWTDKDGNQKTKWLVGANKTNPHKVDNRPYFAEIVNGHGLNLDGQEFWIAPQASSITGAKTVVISRPITKGASDGIVAMATNLLSAMDALTPPGFGYRIIDSQGAVQLQSAETQQWKENFFEECNNDRLLRSTVAAHIRKDMNLNYKGRAHSLLITPLDASPGWSLVVFRDKQPLRTVYLEILTVAGALFLFYAFILLIIFIIFYLGKTKRNRRNEWIWPTPDLLGTYYRSIILSLLFCVLSGVVILFTNRRWTVLFVSIIAFVGIAGFLLRLKLGWVFKTVNKVAQTMRIDRSFDYERAYIANLVMLVVLIGIIPAVAFFKVAHYAETTLFIKDSQLKVRQFR